MFLDDSLFFRKTALLFLTVWISVKDDKTVVGGGVWRALNSELPLPFQAFSTP